MGGLGGMGIVGLLVGSGGMAALPLAAALVTGAAGGTIGAGTLTRTGWNALYRWVLRGLIRSVERILNRVERELVREAELRRLQGG